jgi:hypothetical protein
MKAGLAPAFLSASRPVGSPGRARFGGYARDGGWSARTR